VRYLRLLVLGSGLESGLRLRLGTLGRRLVVVGDRSLGDYRLIVRVRYRMICTYVYFLDDSRYIVTADQGWLEVPFGLTANHIDIWAFAYSITDVQNFRKRHNPTLTAVKSSAWSHYLLLAKIKQPSTLKDSTEPLKPPGDPAIKSSFDCRVVHTSNTHFAAPLICILLSREMTKDMYILLYSPF
jgi:hypothetical protein